MSRLARDISWHLFALVIVVAGLSVLSPLVWWEASQPLNLAPGKPASNRGGIPLRGDRAGRLPLDAATYDPLVRTIDRDPESDPLSTLPHSTLPLQTLPLHTLAIAAPSVEPQIASIGPLVADQIDLDPSISETPALPAEQPSPAADAFNSDATGELRLSATLARPTPVADIRPQQIEPLRQPPESLADEPPSAGKPNDDNQSKNENPGEPTAPQSAAWPHPAALIDQLDKLAATTPAAAAWTIQVKDVLARLTHLPSLADSRGKDDLAALRRLADEAKQLAAAAKDDADRSRLLRAGYALVRRLVIWGQVQTIAARQQTPPAPIIDLAAWQAALHEIDDLFTATGAAANWRTYLLIDRACHEFDQPGRSPADQRELARHILHRLHSTQLSHAQEQFLKSPAFEVFDSELRCRANEAADGARLLAAIEKYERATSEAHARALAAEYDRIRWSCDAEVKELAASVNSYYRNANVRVALSSELVNRLLPAQPAQLESVEDNILGAWVTGQSQTSAKLRIALVPDESRWNIGLEAAGEVASNTASSKGPATFFQNGWSLFRARKRVTVDRRGIRLFSAEAQANANSDLEDYETSFDGIPLLGALVRAVARNQYESSQPAAKVEVEGKIIVRATSQLDQQVAQKLEQGKRDFQVKILNPLRELNLEPAAVDLHTTLERLIGRYRLAGRDEVSAFTPRPQAPGDSMLSVQIHETAFNNVLDKLHLGGRRFELSQLYREMATRFTTRKVEVPEDLPANVYVTFADEEPVRLDCQDGHVRLTIRLRELEQEGTRNRWTNFTVRAYYAPAADQLDANLYRDGIIELIGEGRPLPIGQRVLLSGIFNRVLSRNRQIHVINKQIAQSPQLQDQQVTQFVIHDGWIGVALGPKAPGRAAAMHPRSEIQRD